MSVSTPSTPSESSAAAAKGASEASAPTNPGGTATASTPSSSEEHPGESAYAIVETSGQQVWLQPNRYLDLDRLAAEVDSTVTLDTVLLVRDSKGVTLGQPYVQGASVELTVMAHRRGPKILVYKMRRKKKTRRKTGHRQELTRVLVRSIRVGGQPVS
jgi:large subunit ribosomal protein L21